MTLAVRCSFPVLAKVGLRSGMAARSSSSFGARSIYRQLVPEAARTIRVPTLAERSGDFTNTRDGSGAPIFINDPLLAGTCNATNQTACFRDGGIVNKIPASRFYSNGQAILNLYPEPNVAGRNDFNYSSQRSSEYPRREDILRVDYQITDNTRLSGRFIRNSDEQRFSYGTTTASFNWPLTFTARRNGPGYTYGFTLTHSFSPTLDQRIHLLSQQGWRQHCNGRRRRNASDQQHYDSAAISKCGPERHDSKFQLRRNCRSDIPADHLQWISVRSEVLDSQHHRQSDQGMGIAHDQNRILFPARQQSNGRHSLRCRRTSTSTMTERIRQIPGIRSRMRCSGYSIRTSRRTSGSTTISSTTISKATSRTRGRSTRRFTLDYGLAALLLPADL